MTGWCLTCGEECSNITVEGMGFCEQHGWVHVNWVPPVRADSETSDEAEEEA